MPLRVRFSLAARADIAETVAYITTESGHRRANRWRAGLIATVKTLDEMPSRCPLASEEDLAIVGIRQLFYASHRVLYRVGEDVEILRISHVRRDRLSPEDLL